MTLLPRLTKLQAAADADDAAYQALQAIADDAKQALADAQAKLAQLEHQKDINDAIDNANKPSTGNETDSDKGLVTDGNGSTTTDNGSSTQNGNVMVKTSTDTDTLSSHLKVVARNDVKADTPTSAAAVLPQTGEKSNANATIIGAALLGFATILGLGAKSRKRED